MTFSRGWDGRFLSHLDVMRGWSRALRRSRLPLAYSQGFNPKPKVSYLTPPLSVGMTSECEVFETRIELQLPADSVQEMISAAVPQGISLLGAIESPQDKFKYGIVTYLLLLRRGQADIEPILGGFANELASPSAPVSISDCVKFNFGQCRDGHPSQWYDSAFLLECVLTETGGSVSKKIAHELEASRTVFHFHRLNVK